MFKEFGKFIARGNVLDLAVGIIIGAAFTGIVKSLVDDILMPLIGLATGGIDFSNYFLTLDFKHPGVTYPTLKAAKEAGVATLNYGLFLSALISFLIVAFVIFLIVRAANHMANKPEAAPAPPPPPPREVILLEEIRELLKKRP